ncbi:MAG: efflux RND transporter permease subunit [Verrucomicrobia bacterium]|nr:efflux RND transporter permease subunit [Verrucomicrobiota bacterium]
MRFTDLFIRRPVIATVVNLLILLAGGQAVRSLSVREYPKTDISVITVQTTYYGADAELVRGFITTPLEQAISGVEGIDYMDSESTLGTSTISVHLKLNFAPDAAITLIQSKVSQVRNQLPPASQIPVIKITSPDTDFAAMYLSFSSDELDRNQITDYLTRIVQPKLAAIVGVQEARIVGGRVFAMRIWLDNERMAALNVNPTDVENILQANNYLSAAGQTKGSMTAINLVANTNLQSVEDFKQLAVKQANGAIVRLKDIARVELGAESYDSEVRFQGRTATFIGINALPTANTLDVIKRVRDVLPELAKQLPAGLKADVAYDSTEYITAAINDVMETLIETILIVTIVICLFMGSVRAVVIPVVVIPLSLIGAMSLLLVLGFTLNLLTILAIVLAVGLVVDDAIVVVENVQRNIEEGLPPLVAAIKSARELSSPIIAMTLTLAAVYAPIGVQGGLAGAFFREFAFTLAGAVVISGFVALTLSPMMSSKLLKRGAANRGLPAWISHGFELLRQTYLRILRILLRVKWVGLGVAIILWGLLWPFWTSSSHELAPTEDQGILFGAMQSAPEATLDQIELFSKDVDEVYRSEPETENTFQITEVPGGGYAGLVTKPWHQRKRNMQQIQEEVAKRLADIPGVQMVTLTPAALPGGDDWDVEFVMSGVADPLEMYDLSNQLVEAANQSGKFLFADSDLKFDQPQNRILFDRDKVASMGLNLQQVGGDISTLLSSGYVNYFDIAGRSYQVIPEIQRTQRLNPADLLKRYVTGPNGTAVQLGTFAALKAEVQPEKLNHMQQLNSVTINGVIRSPATVDAALKVLEEKAAQILPGGFTVDYKGGSRQLRREGNAFLGTMILSLIVIYLVLAAQFESFCDPFIVLIGSVPLALVGALTFCHLGYTSVNIYSQVGLITLTGLVAKNGILIVEWANRLQKQGLDKFDAVLEAAGTRLRPILMTSVATIAGHFPLILVTGPGAAARNSVGWVLVSGMFIGTFFTLFVVPSFYLVLARDYSKAADREAENAMTERLISELG